MYECFRAGNSGHCGTEMCELLMSGECENMDEFDQQHLYDLGVIDELPEKEDSAYDAYARAMSILL